MSMVEPTRVTRFKHTDVDPEDTMFEITAGYQTSAPKGGCGSPGCNCSPGHWICITNALKNGTITGKTLHFASRKDLLEYMKEHGMVSKRIKRR